MSAACEGQATVEWLTGPQSFARLVFSTGLPHETAGLHQSTRRCSSDVAACRGAQQQPTPVIGLLHPASPSPNPRYMAGFLKGLKEEGYVDGQNVKIEYRWAHGAHEQLPALIADLVRSRVTVIVPFGTATNAALAAHRAGLGSDIPIVFSGGSDPVGQGLVASLNRPGGNITGSSSMAVELAAKRLELLREIVPNENQIAFLINPDNPAAEVERRDIEAAGRHLARQIIALGASRRDEFEPTFLKLVRDKIGALIISVDTYFYSQIARLASLASRYAVPTIGPIREFAVAGGLMSYGADIPDVNRRAGTYVGKVLKGAKPADLPVLQPTKFETVINLQAARALGLSVPLTLQVAATEVIE